MTSTIRGLSLLAARTAVLLLGVVLLAFSDT